MGKPTQNYLAILDILIDTLNSTKLQQREENLFSPITIHIDILKHYLRVKCESMLEKDEA